MKIGLMLFCISVVCFGKTDAEKFNQALRETIHQVIKDNPETYETRNFGRMPASATGIEPVKSEKVEAIKEEKIHTMEGLQKQGIGLPKW